MTRDEAVKEVKRIYDVDGSEEQIAEVVQRLCSAFPNVLIINLIFHDHRGLTPQQVVDEAMQLEADFVQSRSSIHEFPS